MMFNPNLDRALKEDELRIIGVEFNIRLPNGVTQEMAMFVPQASGLVIPRSARGYGEYVPTITFHSTVGDYTIGQNDYRCPW
jgi:hypothetical protein